MSDPISPITSRDLVSLLHAMHAQHPIAVENKMNFLNLFCDADFVAVTMSGVVIEYEVKVSRSDFCRDRHKLRHEIYTGARPGFMPNRFFYVTAPDIITADCLPEFAGWFEWRGCNLVLRKPAPKMTSIKHTSAVLLRLARAMRQRSKSP